ncbi:ATP-binding protein [Uliginosibacterium flavum]|uniref:histidine kinase n=1 Tax=Uliginosibacterium flavum TaxID=1396831 RepID=A0ABV2TL90_9RHOO
MKADWLWIALSFSMALLGAAGLHQFDLPPLLGLCLAATAGLILPCVRLMRQAAKTEPEQVHSFVQRLIDAIPEPVYIKDAQSRFLWINQAFAEERRRPASEIIGLTSFDLSPNPEASRTLSSEDSEVLAGGSVFKEQHTTYPITGEECFRLVSKRLCFAPTGAALIVGAHFDITGLRQAERATQESLTREVMQSQRIQTYMQRFVDVIPQPVYVKDAASRYLLVNEALCRNRLLRPEQLVGKSPFDLSDNPEHAQQVIEEDQEVLNGLVIAKEECLKHPVTGKNVYRFISKGSCEDANGHPVIVGANFDITAWREAELRWQHASTAKSQFLAAMSHEIRTPLSGVIGTLRLAMKDAQILPGTRDYLDTSLNSAESLLRIISDILDFSKIEAGQLLLEDINFDLHSTAREILKSFREQAEQRALRFILEVDPQLPQHFRGDPTRIRQILINLVGNALKFTEQGEISLRIRANPVHNGRQQVIFCVADTGIGIAPDVVPKLFQMFQQADTSTTRRFGGTGLGLAISQQLVEAMGGKLSVVSHVGVGSSFEFDLQLAPGEAPAPVPTASDELPPHSRRLNILCAEDVRVNQLIIRAQLKHLGHNVTMVENGRAAIAALAENDFDLILMDGRMPVMDGADATRAIRAGGLPDTPVRNPKIRIVAVTANASAEDRALYLACGMNDYLTKPVHESQLHAALSRTIEALDAEIRSSEF